MIATNSNNVRNNFNDVCNKIVQDSEVAVIIRENDENVVLMSQSQYENIMENFYIRNSKNNYEWLKESIRQAEEGKLIEFTLEETE
ncbi:MAG: prevent-host-death protein [Ruminococcaceae bacterium]|nr:prevent-host-death protein [Oscillospiraceae bacterium]